MSRAGANTGEPGHDPVDLEWDSDFVEAGDAVCPAALQAKIQEEDYLISQVSPIPPPARAGPAKIMK